MTSMQNAGANNSKSEPYWQKTYRLIDELRSHLSAIPAGELESLIGLFGEEFAYLRQCEGHTWIAAFWRDGEAVEAEGYSAEKALEKLLNTRAGAEPATRQADHGRSAVGRTGDSISPTGAVTEDQPWGVCMLCGAVNPAADRNCKAFCFVRYRVGQP